MRPRALVLLVVTAVLIHGAGCCRCCRCCTPRDSRLPPQELPRDERIPPTALRPEGVPASLPTGPPAEPKLTGAYDGS